VKQILSVCEVPLVAALPKLAALWAMKQVNSKASVLCNLSQPLANSWRPLDAPSDALAIKLDGRKLGAIAAHDV